MNLFRRKPTLNLPQTWQAIAALPLDGNTPIVPAKVGAVQPLKAKKAHEFLRLLERKRA